MQKHTWNSLTQPFNLMSTENAVAISLELVHQGLGAADVFWLVVCDVGSQEAKGVLGTRPAQRNPSVTPYC